MDGVGVSVIAVYADVLVVVNYIVNLLLLVAAGKLLGAVVSRRRLCAAALLGAVGSLVIFLPYLGFWVQLLYKLTLTLGMTAAAFGVRPWKRLAKALFVLFTVSFIFAGLMLALSFLLAPAGMVFYNGVVYFDISALTLLVCTTVAYLLILLFERLFFSRTTEKQLYRLTIFMNGKSISCDGLADTGCNLKEPFSGAPVIVCDGALLAPLLPESGFRVIPCQTVTGAGTLRGFQPAKIHIMGGGKDFCTSDIYIASGREPICGEYQALINPQVVDRA